MKKTFYRYIITFVILMAASCGSDQAPQDRQPDSPSGDDSTVPTLNVGHVGHDHQLALYVAANEGKRLESQGGSYLNAVKEFEIYDLVDDGKTIARLRFIKVGGGSQMPASMERGEIDLGLGGVAPVTFFIDKGNDFKIIFPLQTDGDMLVMANDFPASDWESFVKAVRSGGKTIKIGYKAPLAVALLIFEKALEEEKIPLAKETGEPGAKVELVNLQNEGNMVPTLANGAVDGFVINQPHASLAVGKGAGKIVCDLSDLPPKGKWEQHPCCCVAVKQPILQTHRDAIKAFLKVLHASTQLINENQELAVKVAAAWTKLPESVERDSVPTVNYLSVPSEAWIDGMKTWAQMMKDNGKFTGRLKDKSLDEIVQITCDLSIIQEILSEN